MIVQAHLICIFYIFYLHFLLLSVLIKVTQRGEIMRHMGAWFSPFFCVLCCKVKSAMIKYVEDNEEES